MTEHTEGGQPDAEVLREAVRRLDERNSADLQLPSPSTEFVLYETARLLESIASPGNPAIYGQTCSPDIFEDHRSGRHCRFRSGHSDSDLTSSLSATTHLSSPFTIFGPSSV